MKRIKETVKKILIKLHLYKSRTEELKFEQKKNRPDFDFSYRNIPYINTDREMITKEFLGDGSPQIAIHIHVFFLEVLDEIVDLLNSIPCSYDCYVSTDNIDKKSTILKKINGCHNLSYLQIDIMDNRGRDVGPLIEQMAPVIDKYKYLAHVHTKKSMHTDFGDDWRHFLYRNMFGGINNVSAIINAFERNSNLGLIIPEVYPIVRELMAWDNTKEEVALLLEKMDLHYNLPEQPICPVGDMFWAKVDAIKPLFNLGIEQSDFQEEAGQLNYTLAHVIERVWCYMIQALGYEYKVWVNGLEESKESQNNRILFYAVSDKKLKFDYNTLISTARFFDKCVVIVNDNSELLKYHLPENFRMILTQETKMELMCCDALKKEKRMLEDYNEIAFTDNTLVGPIFDLGEIMDKMLNDGYNMWSLFYAPISKSSFVLFNLDKTEFTDIICTLENNSIIKNVYIKESAYIGEWLFTSNPIYELCLDYIILHSPFIKGESIKQLPENEKKLVEKLLAY